MEYEQHKSSQCTFKPQINEYKTELTRSLSNPRIAGPKKTSRCHELYNLARKYAKREDVKTDDYVFKKEPGEYTFAPKLSSMKTIGSAAVNDPSVANVIERLKRGREERERVKRMIERGIDAVPKAFNTNPLAVPKALDSSADKIQADKTPDTQQEEKLYIDVNMGERMERIVVHKGDTAANLAREFAERHCRLGSDCRLR